MVRVRAVAGIARFIFLQRLKIEIFLHFLPAFFSGRMKFGRFFTFLKRLLFFLAKLSHNKFARIGKMTRIDLYVPGFPGPAFYTACEKFSVLRQKLPCATALISVTSACRYDCPHCYQRFDRGKDMPIETLISAVRYLQNLGVAFFNIEGGDPFLVYERLKRVCAAIDMRSEIWINSTGDGMTLERLKELKDLNLTAIMFSLHAAEPGALNRFMNSDSAWDTMIKGIDLCNHANIPVSFNTCISKEDFFNGQFEKIMERAKELNGCLLQLIKPKPAGGRMDKGVEIITPADRTAILHKIHCYNHDRDYRSYPPISAQIIEESPEVFGCTAGGTDRFYINAKGDMQPCEFLNLSFGNIVQEDISTIYARMRACFEKPGQTWLCEAYAPAIRELAGKGAILPLDPEKSKAIYQTWDRGKPTELYKVIEG
jgi:MoaA/NifB/PqqE/SkfB family radical SAM enzyme